MQELLDDLIQYLRGVWLKRRYILIASWIICPIGWLIVTMLPNQYTSEARVYADTRSILQPLLRGLAIQTDPSQELALIVKTLLNRENLEIIARDTDADVRAENSAEYEAIISDLKSNIRIRSVDRENLYTISYRGEEPAFVKDVVQAALNVFVENALGEKRLDTEQANQILTKQLDEYEARLIKEEKKLADFKREYTGYMPGSDRSYYSQLDQQKNLLEDAQLALSETQTRVVSARAQLSREKEHTASQLSRVETEYDERIESLQLRLDDFLFRFTDRHPDVVETRRQLKGLQTLKNKALSKLSSTDVLPSNSVYQDLKLTVSRLENEVASLKVRVQQYKNKEANLQEKLNKIPDVEARMISLTRSYQITKAKYEQLLSRKENALISQSVAASADDIKFRIIDAPRLPLTPSGPMRSLLLAAVLLLGIGSGVGVSFVVSQISPVVSTTKQLYQLANFPVFGVVSATQHSGLEQWEKRKTKWFLLLNILLITLFVGVMVMNTIPSVHERLMQGIKLL